MFEIPHETAFPHTGVAAEQQHSSFTRDCAVKAVAQERERPFPPHRFMVGGGDSR
jgi:hypothetical protein